MRYSTPSLILSAAAIIRYCTSLPLEARQQNLRRAAYSIVNVDGSASSLTTETIAQTVTKITSEISTATVTTTASVSAGVIVATIDVVQSSTTSTIVVTATPEVFDPAVTVSSDPTTSSTSSSSSDPPAMTSSTTAPAEIPPPMPFGDVDPPITSTILVSSATISDADPTPADDCEEGDMDEDSPTTTTSHLWSHPTAYPTAYGSGITPSDMPTLPKETPTWYNRTEIPPYRAMKPRAGTED